MNRPDRTLGAELRDALAAGTGCADGEAWARYASGEASDDERTVLDAHADACPGCAAERDLARAFDPAAPASKLDEDAAAIAAGLERAFAAAARPPDRRSELLRVASRWLAAAAVLLALAGTWRLVRTPDPTLPDPIAGDVVRGSSLEPLAPLGELETVPDRFRWSATERADRYRVELRRVDDQLLWQATSSGTELGPATGDLPALARGVVYRWTVTALDAAGRELTRSPPASFRLTPEVADDP